MIGAKEREKEEKQKEKKRLLNKGVAAVGIGTPWRRAVEVGEGSP